MISIFSNTTTRKHYNEKGDLYINDSPSMFFRGTERITWYLCTDTPELDPSTQTPEDDWDRCTQFAPGQGYTFGAYLTADDNYTLRKQGTLKNAISPGSIPQITSTIQGASFSIIPKNGSITLFDSQGDTETFEYSARSISGIDVTFTMTGATTQKSYPAGSSMDVGEEVYMQASMNTLESDTANGKFVFDITAYSDKMRQAIVYSNVRQLNISGLELAIFKITTSTSAKTDAERYVLDTFSIRSGIADTGANVTLTPTSQNEVVTLVNTLLSAGFEIQFSSDGTNWHSQQAQSTDTKYRFRSLGSGGTWSGAINLPLGQKGEDCFVYIGYASDAQGSNFSLTPSSNLKYISFLVSNVLIANPTIEDFEDAECTWSKYIGDNGTTPSINPTTKHWMIGTTDTGIRSQAIDAKIQYSENSTQSEGSSWHNTFTAGDNYMRVSVDNGTTWSGSMRMIGEPAPYLQIQHSENGISWHGEAERTTADKYIRFSVDGGTTWGDAMQAVPFAPKLQYSVDNTSGNFHDTYSPSDYYVRVSTDNGTTWTTAILFRGADGTSFEIDATGTYAERSTHDTENKGFSYLVTSGEHNGYIYFKKSNTAADWNEGSKFTPDGISIQYSENGTSGWHTTASSLDRYMRFSTDSGNTWTAALMFAGETHYLYTAYSHDSAGGGFSLTPSPSLTYRAEFHSTSYIASPTLSDFTEAGAQWLRYIGTGWIAGTSNPSASTGNNGDLYLNTTTGYVWKKENGAWAQLFCTVGPAGVGITTKGGYDATVTYSANDAVTHEGNLCVAKKQTTGHTPPSLPTTSNEWWDIYVKHGNDIKVQYSTDNSSWHNTYASNDTYIRFSIDNGTTWSTGAKFVGDGNIPLTNISTLSGTSATVEPGKVYKWTLTGNSTLNITGGSAGMHGDCLIDITPGNYTLSPGTGLTIVSSLTANELNRYAVRWDGTTATAAKPGAGGGSTQTNTIAIADSLGTASSLTVGQFVRLKSTGIDYKGVAYETIPVTYGWEMVNRQADWNQVDATSPDFIKNKPTIPAIPVIPTVNDATITFTQGGVTKGSFTTNQSSAATIALDAGGGASDASHAVMHAVWEEAEYQLATGIFEKTSSTKTVGGVNYNVWIGQTTKTYYYDSSLSVSGGTRYLYVVTDPGGDGTYWGIFSDQNQTNFLDAEAYWGTDETTPTALKTVWSASVEAAGQWSTFGLIVF